MRILSARVAHVHHNRRTGKVDATVMLLVRETGYPNDYQVQVHATASAHAPGAAPLRDRLTATAKLIFASRPDQHRTQSFAA